MKTLKLISSFFLMSLSLASFSQSSASGDKSGLYFVQLKHTPEQCVATLSDVKAKGDAFLSKFEWGCMSGDHTAYAFLEGKSEADVKMLLPKDEQATAKIQKVDKFTADQIEKIHKNKMEGGMKK
jgi:hypothetical protein